MTSSVPAQLSRCSSAWVIMRQIISNVILVLLPYLDDWIVYHPDQNSLLFHKSVLLQTLELVGLKLNVERSEPLFSPRHSVSGGQTSSGSGESCSRSSFQISILPSLHVHVVRTSLHLHWVNQICLRSHPTGSSVPDTITTTFPLYGPGHLVCSTVQVPLFGPSATSMTVTGPLLPTEIQ